MNFSQKLQEIKLLNAFTNAQIADFANVSEGAVRSWLNGAKKPNIESIVLLCKKLNVSPNYILGMESDNPRALSDDEQELLNEYRKLDKRKKTIALAEIYKLSE